MNAKLTPLTDEQTFYEFLLKKKYFKNIMNSNKIKYKRSYRRLYSLKSSCPPHLTSNK